MRWFRLLWGLCVAGAVGVAAPGDADGEKQATSADIVVTDAPARAAKALQEHAERDPSAADAPRAMERAIVIFTLLDRHRDVDRAVMRYRELFRKRAPVRTAEIEHAFARYQLDYEKRSSYRRSWHIRADKILASLVRHPNPVVRWPVLVTQAQRHRTKRKPGKALASYRKVRKNFRSITSLRRNVKMLGGHPSVQAARMRRCAEAVGESIYELESAQLDLLSTRVPIIATGTRTAVAMDQHISEVANPWFAAQHSQLVKATKRFKALGRLGRHAPRWQVKGTARVARAWASLVASARAAPYPRAWDRSGFVPGVDPPLLWAELRSQYLTRLDSMSGSAAAQAKKAHVRCLDASTDLLVFNEDSRDCHEWLAKMYPAEFPLLSEFRPAATQVGVGVPPAALPED